MSTRDVIVMHEGIKVSHMVANREAVFLAVVVIAVLSYRYFAGPADGPSGSSRSGEARQGSSRGRQVTPAMVEVYSQWALD